MRIRENSLSENSVLLIEVGLLGVGNARLGLVRVWTGVRHRDDAARVELTPRQHTALGRGADGP